MNRIALIVPHFGHFNNYFKLWLNSCRQNTKVDFLIFTDDQKAMSYISECGGANIKVFETNLNEIKKMFEAKLHQNISLDVPYKLCDFKAMYGVLFADYLNGYEFWGHCDNDLIFGDLSAFVTDKLLDKYDKVFTRGHLTIYRNRKYVNEYFKKSETFDGIPSWKEVIINPKGCAFDEWAGVSRMWNALNPDKMYDGILFDDVNYLKKQFLSSQKMVMHTDDTKSNFLFEYDHGKLYRYGLDKTSGTVIKEETMYVHFQKRPMKVELTDMSHYICKPNAFVDYQPITEKLLLDWGRKYRFYDQYFKIRWRNLLRKLKEKTGR